MREYVLVADINCDCDEEYLARENIAVLPQYYHFNDGVIYGDEIRLTQEEFYARLKNERAYSMGCNPERVQGILEGILKEGKDIIAVMCSSDCSGSFSTVRMVASELMEAYPGARIEVLDSRFECAPAGIMVEMANEMRKEGKSFDEVVGWIESVKDRFDIFFLVDDLSYLVRGGRLSRFSGTVGSMLNIKPILHFEDGKIVALSKCRGRQMGKKFMLDELKKMNPDKKMLVIGNTMCADEAKEFGALVEKETGGSILYISPISLIIGTHVGPGAIGVAFCRNN